MVLDTAKLKNRKSTIMPGMRGRDAARKLTLKVNILQVFTIDFSEIQFTTRNRKDRTKEQRYGRVGTAGSHVPSLQRGIQKIPRTVVSHIE